jgi:hypothetical protein
MIEGAGDSDLVTSNLHRLAASLLHRRADPHGAVPPTSGAPGRNVR